MGNIVNLLNNIIIKEFIINVMRTKIFLPHFFSLNNPIIELMNSVNNKTMQITNQFQKKACAGIISIPKSIDPAKRSVIIAPIAKNHKLICLSISSPFSTFSVTKAQPAQAELLVPAVS